MACLANISGLKLSINPYFGFALCAQDRCYIIRRVLVIAMWAYLDSISILFVNLVALKRAGFY